MVKRFYVRLVLSPKRLASAPQSGVIYIIGEGFSTRALIGGLFKMSKRIPLAGYFFGERFRICICHY